MRGRDDRCGGWLVGEGGDGGIFGVLGDGDVCGVGGGYEDGGGEEDWCICWAVLDRGIGKWILWRAGVAGGVSFVEGMGVCLNARPRVVRVQALEVRGLEEIERVFSD